MSDKSNRRSFLRRLAVVSGTAAAAPFLGFANMFKEDTNSTLSDMNPIKNIKPSVVSKLI